MKTCTIKTPQRYSIHNQRDNSQKCASVGWRHGPPCPCQQAEQSMSLRSNSLFAGQLGPEVIYYAHNQKLNSRHLSIYPVGFTHSRAENIVPKALHCSIVWDSKKLRNNLNAYQQRQAGELWSIHIKDCLPTIKITIPLCALSCRKISKTVSNEKSKMHRELWPPPAAWKRRGQRIQVGMAAHLATPDCLGHLQPRTWEENYKISGSLWNTQGRQTLHHVAFVYFAFGSCA